MASVSFDGTDFKLTANASTSDLYDDTGRMILFAEDFEGTDGTDLDVYDAAWTVTHDVGTETIEIDDAQKHTGSTSLGIYRDGVNNPNALRTIDIQDIGTVDFWFRKDAINTRVDIVLGEGGNAQGYFKFNADGNINILYGDGVGGNDTILVAYSANIWYHIKLDFDIANSKWRVWINNVLYPGSNADAGGWDNLFVDRTPASINRLTISSDIGTHWSWIDDLNIYAGFEDFSALSSPHSIDEITEALSPSGTNYGRGTQDGDWATNGASITVDNTKAVIGTNSIKGNDLDYNQLINYAYDAVIDISSFTNMRFYCFPETGMTTIRVYLYCTTGGSREISVTVAPNKWNYVDLDINGAWSGWDETGSFNATIYNQLFIMNFTAATNNLDMWIDGFHFYGDEAAGTEWQENSLDPNGAKYSQDRAMYNIFDVDDNSGSEDEWEAIMTAATDNLTVEWADVANAGIADGGFDGQITLTGFDADNHIKWTSVGDSTPTNDWTLNTTTPASDTAVAFTHVTFEQYYRLVADKATGNMTLIDFVSTLSGVTANGIGAAIHPSATLINLNITTAANSYAAFVPAVQSATPYEILDSTLDASAGGVVFRFWAGDDDWNIYCRNCDFDITDTTTGPGDEAIISLNHNHNSIYAVVITSSGGYAAGFNYSDIEAGFEPTPNDIFYLQEGIYNADTGGQVNIIYRLESAAGTTVDNTVENGLVVLNPDTSLFLGTLTETYHVVRTAKAWTRPVKVPVKLPMLRPIIASDT